MDVCASWTMANPKYKPGEPMLSEEALKLAGPSCEGLLTSWNKVRMVLLTFLQRWLHPTFIVRMI